MLATSCQSKEFPGCLIVSLSSDALIKLSHGQAEIQLERGRTECRKDEIGRDKQPGRVSHSMQANSIEAYKYNILLP